MVQEPHAAKSIYAASRHTH